MHEKKKRPKSITGIRDVKLITSSPTHAAASSVLFGSLLSSLKKI
jgi:hypothetical protein